MAKFFIDILAKAKLRKIGTIYTTNEIISTTVKVQGEVIKDKEQIDAYTRYEEFYEYDIYESEPIGKDEFYKIDTKGDKHDNSDYEIIELLEIFDENIEFIEE